MILTTYNFWDDLLQVMFFFGGFPWSLSPNEVAARLCSFAKSVARGKGGGKAP